MYRCVLEVEAQKWPIKWLKVTVKLVIFTKCEFEIYAIK